MLKKFSNTGISLISLIITIIVIIILAAIVIFSGMGTPEKAQLSKVISDIDNVQTAVDQAYYGLYTEKAVAGEVWTKSQFYEAVATGKTNRDELNSTGLVEIAEDSLVKINLPKYEGRTWYIAVSDVSDTVKTGSAVLSPGFESDGKVYATLLDVQNGGGNGSGSNGSSETFVVVEPTKKNDWKWVEIDGGKALRITGYKGSDTEIVVPNSIDGVKVTEIGDGSENIWREIFDTILIDDKVGKYVEEDISKIIISDGIKNINDYVFVHTSGLKEITLPNSITSVGQYAFYGCNSLTSLTIPSGVTSIGDGAFRNCDSLTSLTIPSGVTSIGDGAFRNCGSLTSLTIPTGVTSIGNEAFYNCQSLTSLTIPSGVTSIGEFAFYICKSLTSITIPSGVTSIGGSTFSDCSSLTSVTIPSSVTSIGKNAFSNCSSLTSMTIPSSVTSIGESAFRNCDSLTSVTIPSSVTSISENAFYYINADAQITCDFASKPTGWDDNWTNCTNVNFKQSSPNS